MRHWTKRNLLATRSLTLLVFSVFLVISLFMLSAFDVLALPASPDLGSEVEFAGNYDWETELDSLGSTDDFVTYHDFRDNLCLAATSAATCLTNLNNRKIRFDTADELYRFSLDVSFEYIYQTAFPAENVKLSAEKMTLLMSLYYTLGNDIDYSVMNAKTFAPIGYDFRDTSNVLYKNVFTGTFDGQGFTISNLYVGGYDYMIYVDQIDEINSVDIALSPYYSMFTINEGTITNLGLINPTLELLDTHIDINSTANLVGYNSPSGVIDHVYVIDNRTDVLEAGIRYRVGTASQSFSAAGIVHTNLGTFTNAFFSSKVVVNGSWLNRFATQPVVFLNSGTVGGNPVTGTLGNIVYDSTVYLLNVTVNSVTFSVTTPNPALQTAEATTLLKSASSSLNTASDRWYFYAQDTYPQLLGLEFVSGYYLIDNAIDLVFFGRVIGYVTIANGVSYGSASYRLTTSIDMSKVAPGAYKTPSVNFNGILTGYNSSGTTLQDNYYIYNLDFTVGTIRGTLYYAGLFSVIGASGKVEDLNINQSSIALSDTENYYSMIFYVGMVAGRVSGGTIEDVQVDVPIHLGTQAIGETYAGGIVGQSSGLLQRVSFSGSIDAGVHVYQTSYNVVPRFAIGGVVGAAAASALTLKNVVNNGTITGYGTSSTFNFASGSTEIIVRLGGVIGYVLHTAVIRHSFTDIANKGDITFRNVINTVALPSSQRIGGVFGEMSGAGAPVLETTGVFVNANYYNEGDIIGAYAAETAIIRAAGIGVANMSVATEFALFFNHGTFQYNTTGAASPTGTFLYTGIIYDIGSAALTLSRVYNHGDFAITSNFYNSVNPLYYSLSNNSTLIRYSHNHGNVSVMNNGGLTTITLAASNPLSVAGITTSLNVDLLNVTNYGNIDVVNVSIGANRLSVAGIIFQVTSGRYIKNILNQGNVTVAKIAGTGTITGTSPNFVTNTGGVFIAGIANQNYSGDLHVGGVTQASLGIINSINYGTVSTSYGLQAQNLFGISGTTNTFAAGIATLNAGSIQDVANLGDIGAYNSTVHPTTTIQVSAGGSTSTTAGVMLAYLGGVTSAGVVAVTLTGNARVYDSANIGDVMAMAYRYSRASGILAISLYSEALSGGINTANSGLANTIQTSVLSNGLNYGNISSLTNQISQYTTSVAATNFTFDEGIDTRTVHPIRLPAGLGSEDRPGIYSSAGGVIGYGLCTMIRMMNHGTISATDVAGGIVGATYVTGNGVVTVVNINTAINYGKIKAVVNTKVMQDADSINPFELDPSSISAAFYADGSTFIFGNLSETWRRLTPSNRRGFGGIFGRLQRGYAGTMTSTGGSFNFVVNTDDQVDLVGRLDQVNAFTTSASNYSFIDAIYYTTRLNDSTQYVFTGFYFAWAALSARQGTTNNFTYTATPITWYRRVGAQSGIYAVPNAPATFTTLPSATSLTTGNRYTIYPIGLISKISESPNDACVLNGSCEYMYSPTFAMRSTPALQEYIYFIEPELLAPRFQSGGLNPRTNGMYVLSTSLGSTVGSVLPSNINEEALFPFNEDLIPPPPLTLDYASISSSYLTPIDEFVLDKYNDLKQTMFNDKSAFIDDGVTFVLEESNGSETVLANGVYDDIAKSITFTISLEAYLALQVSANYQVNAVNSSANSLLARRASDYFGHSPSEAELHAYRALLYPERYSTISSSYPPTLAVTLPSRSIVANTTLSLGYFTIYSEAFVGSDLYAHAAYYTDYQVFITFTPTAANIPTGTLDIDTVSFNGGANAAVVNQANVTALGTVNYNGSIRFNFLDTKGVLAAGYDFKQYIAIRYSDGTVVNPMYYTITSIPVVINGSDRTYSVTITFTNQSRAGDYFMDYRYFATSPVLSVLFDKGASNVAQVSALNYYSNNNSVSIVGTTITSYVNLGYVLSVTGFTTNTNTGLASYLSNVTYDINFMTAGSFVISPFASLVSVTLVSTTITNGYKTYQIQYLIQAENGTQVTYTHNIIERTIDLTAVLKNGNEIDIADVFAIREDLMTEFRVDLGLDSTLDLYRLDVGAWSYFQIYVSATELDGVTPYLSNEIVGITYRTENNEDLYIDMDYTTLPGYYSFSFRFYRDGSSSDYVTLSTPLTIRKNAGTSPYLFDIRFSTLANETSYPVIRLTDIDGTILTGTGKDLRVFFGGIDYDNADVEGYRFFRVDGQVSNVALDEYVPYMLEYLPYGATISRYAYNGTSWYWTTEVDNNSAQVDKNTLIADFTVFPDTLLEPEEGEDVVIRYRVTSEDGLTFTYYYITVTDITFNVTLIFDIYYCTGVGLETCTIASSSVGFANELVIITVKNFDTNGDASVVNVVNPVDYPSFSVINGLNNQMTQFYYTYSGSYRYSFGRNISGFYVFNLELPLDRYLNPRYQYTIEHQFYFLNDASTYVPGVPGKYFYIEAGTKNRTRRFNIYIRELSEPSTAAPWGLFDFFRTWGEEE